MSRKEASVKYKAVFFHPCLPVIALALTSLLFITTISSSVKPPEKSAQVTDEELRANVVTLHPNLEIVKIELLAEDTIYVTVRNGYSLDITAVAASLGQELFYYHNYLYAEHQADKQIAPGAVDKFLYPNPLLKGEKLFFRAVVFSDGTSQGDPRDVEYIINKRRAMKVQLNRVKNAMQDLAKADESSVHSRLEELRQVAESLPVEDIKYPTVRRSDKHPVGSSFEAGLKQARQIIQRRISDMQTDLDNEKIESFYQNEQLQITRHSKYENFRQRFQRVDNLFKGMLNRL